HPVAIHVIHPRARPAHLGRIGLAAVGRRQHAAAQHCRRLGRRLGRRLARQDRESTRLAVRIAATAWRTASTSDASWDALITGAPGLPLRNWRKTKVG